MISDAVEGLKFTYSRIAIVSILTRPQSSSYNFIQRAALGEVGAQVEIGSHHPLLPKLAPCRVFYEDDWGRVRSQSVSARPVSGQKVPRKIFHLT